MVNPEVGDLVLLKLDIAWYKTNKFSRQLIASWEQINNKVFKVTDWSASDYYEDCYYILDLSGEPNLYYECYKWGFEKDELEVVSRL